MTLEKGNEAEIPEPQEIQTPTADEQLETLKSQVQALTSEKERLEGGYKGLQRTLEERNKESRKQADLENRITGLQDTIELLATAVSARGEIEQLEPDARQDVLAQLRKQRSEQEAKRKTEESQIAQREYAQKADAIFNRAKAIFGNDGDDIERVEELLIGGRLDRAEARVLKGEQGKEKPLETEEQRVDKLANEKFQKLLKDKGLLEEHSGYPTASGGTPQEVMSLYIDGKIDAEEAKRRGVKFD